MFTILFLHYTNKKLKCFSLFNDVQIITNQLKLNEFYAFREINRGEPHFISGYGSTKYLIV